MDHRRKTTDKWVSALLSIIFPGVGHLYLGYLGRGLTIIGAFIIDIALVTFASLSFIFFAFPVGIALATLFGLIIPVIYFFGIFDALQMAERKHARSGIFPLPEDAPGMGWEESVEPEPEWPEEMRKAPKNGSRAAGIALIVIGIVLLIGFLLPGPLLMWLFDNFQTLFAFLLLVCGGWLIWNQWVRGKGDRL